MVNHADPAAEPIAKETARLIKASGHTQLIIANYLTRRLGRDVNNTQVSRWKTGTIKTPADVMDALRDLADQPADVPPLVVPLTESAEVVPLFGYANAAGTTLRLSEDQRVGNVPIHPAQRGSRSAFAVRVFGDTLAPRLRNGDIAYAIRNMTPTRGAPCVIELEGGEALIKIFESADERTLFYSQLDPKREATVPIRQVIGLHAVVSVTFGPGGH